MPNRTFISLTVGAALLVGGLSSSIIFKQGYPQRYEGVLAAGVKEMRVYREKYWGDQSAYTKIKDFKSNEISIEVIGDSWAQDIANSLVEAGDYQVGYRGTTGHFCKAITLAGRRVGHKDYEVARNKCPTNINRFNTELPNTDLVIIADNQSLLRIHERDTSIEISKNIKTLRIAGYSGPVLIIANRPWYKKPVFSIVREYGFIGDGVNKYAQQYLGVPVNNMLKQDHVAEAFYQKNNVYYYSPVKDLCREGICKISTQGSLLYHDKAHLTMSGTRYVSSSLSSFIKEDILNLKE